MATLKKPTIREIYKIIINTYETKTGETAPLLEKAAVKSLAWAIAGVASLLWAFAIWQYAQLFVQTAGLAPLKMWGNLVGLGYKEASKVALQILVEGVTAPQIRAGTIWKHLSTGLTFRAISSSIQIDGKVIISVEASQAGVIGNLPAGEILYISNPLDGVPNSATAVTILIPGIEDEGKEHYRSRVLVRYRKKPQGGSGIDYFTWATEVPGIVDALPYVLEEGLTTLFLVKEGSGLDRTPSGSVSPNPFPQWIDGQPKDLEGEGQFLAVANSINSSTNNKNDRRPVQAPVELRMSNYIGYKIEILGLNLSDDATFKLIKTVLVSELDKKRPHIKVIGYTMQDATINSNTLSALVQGVILANQGAFEKFTLKNANNDVILTSTLGIGSLAYIEELIINGTVIKVYD